MLDTQDDLYEMKFYKYTNFKLSECSFAEAINSLEHKTNNIFTFIQIDNERI